jgi:hypothetical protein
VARAIGPAKVRFRLDQAQYQPLPPDLMDQITAQEIPGDGLGGTAVEGNREGTETAHAIRNDIIRFCGTCLARSEMTDFDLF